MKRNNNPYLFWSGMVLVLGALIHLATLWGGPDWYAYIGAPDGIVAMAKAGKRYPVVVCLIIAGFLFVCAAFAFSGAGLIRRLPLLRTVLALMAGGLIVRGISFIPLVIWWPEALAFVTSIHSVNTLLLITSAICLGTGLGLAIGLRKMMKPSV
ncbi:hypothetical protein ACO0LF_19880 [Undibacterium sp. Di27W]|uniref:hypothetical protein n=1 Tax=Undibacterium sp. Di27W TaxID=3413036 RepID=UPI003BF3BF6D